MSKQALFCVYTEHSGAVETSRRAHACNGFVFYTCNEVDFIPTTPATCTSHTTPTLASPCAYRYAPHGTRFSTLKLFFSCHVAWLSWPMPDLQSESAARLALAIILVRLDTPCMRVYAKQPPLLLYLHHAVIMLLQDQDHYMLTGLVIDAGNKPCSNHICLCLRLPS